MPMQAPSLTLGIEEEYQIIDPETRELRSYITEILDHDHLILGEIKPELHQSIVEVGSPVSALGGFGFGVRRYQSTIGLGDIATAESIIVGTSDGSTPTRRRAPSKCFFQ